MDVDEKPSRRTFYYLGVRPEEEENYKFQCRLRAKRCADIRQDGKRCRRKTVIGAGHCWQHLLMHHGLGVFDSKIKKKNAQGEMESIGKGMYALGIPGTIAFRKGEIVMYYGGETSEDVETRYPGFTGIYVLGGVQGQIKDVDTGEMFEAHVPSADGACLRSIGTLVNHKPKKQANVMFCVSRHDGIQEHALRATRNIRAGEELYVNYGPNYIMKGPKAGTYETRFLSKGQPVWYK